jgi:hypothetical protein
VRSSTGQQFPRWLSEFGNYEDMTTHPIAQILIEKGKALFNSPYNKYDRTW